MTIPPPPWEQQNPSAASTPVTPAPEEAPQMKIPPPPWETQPSLGDKAQNTLDDFYANNPGAEQAYNQKVANAPEFAATQARGEILRREAGDPTPHLTYDAQGNPVIEEIPQPAQKLSLGEKAAILQAQQTNAGINPAPSAEQQDAQIKAATMAGNTGIQNFGGAVGQTYGGVRAGLVKTYDPQAGNAMAEDYQNTYASDPDSNAALAGRVTAGVTMAAATPAAPLAVPLIFGAQTFGDVRGEVAQRRAQGQVITPAQEYMSAGGQALMTFLASRVGGKYTEGAAKRLLLQNAELRREGASVVANTIKQYALSAGVGMSDMEAMTLANNAIAKYTVAPDRDLSEGALESGILGGVSGPAMTGLHAAVHGTPEGPQQQKPTGPISAEEIKAATPSAEQMANITTAPSEPPVNNTEPAKPKGPTSLETSKQKFRIQDGAESRGVEVQFEDPNDKALYIATQPRKGKLQAEARAHLEAQGYDENAIANYGDEVRARLDEAAKGHTGDVLRLPKVQEAGQAPAEGVQGAPATLPGTVPAGDVAKEQGTVQASGPELKPGEGQGTLFLPSKEHEQQAVDAAATEVRGFKRVAPKTVDHAEAAKVFAKRGVKVVYFQGEGAGFRMKKYPGVLFVNADKPVSTFREAISHEFIHELHDTRPGLFQELSNAVPPTERAGWEQWYTEQFAKQRPGEKPHALQEEGVTTPIGKLTSSNERVWAAAMGKDPSLLQKIGDFARPFLAKFSSKSRQIQAAVKAFQATLDIPIGKSTKQAKSYGKEAVNFLPSDRVRSEAEEYTREAGIPYHPDTTNATVNVPRAKDIAKWYDAAKHTPNDPAVKASYDALKKETLAQFKFLEKKGIKIEPWTREGQPYADSKEMHADAQNNKHLWFFQGGDMPKDHPLAEKAPGTPYTYNDVFRAVHDYFGHAKEGTGFGPRGEENAWRSHSQMYSEEARPAMTTETRGQNSWVNFGPYGEANQANPKNTRYAEQKATLPSPEYTKVEQENGTTFAPDFPPKDYPESDYGYWLTPDGKAHAVPMESHDDVARGKLGAKSTSDALARGYVRIVNEGQRYASIEISEDANPAAAKKFAAAAIANGREVNVDVFGSGERLHLTRLSDLSKMDKIGAESAMTFLPSTKEEREKALKSIETTKLREEPLGSEKGMFGDITPSKGSVNNKDVARRLNDRTQKLAGQAKSRESEKLARAIAAGIPEAEYQLSQPDSGKSWYKDDIAKMEKTMTERHPSLYDPSHMTIFKAILAITSQGNNPNVNLKFADPIYEHWVDTGEIMKTQPGGKNWPGTLGENYKLPLGRLEKLIEQKGIKDAAAWLLSKHTVAEVNAFSESIGLNGNVSGPKDAQVYGMEMFGPKIGVFALNQHGIQEKITKDMWFSRTWNRWMGTMIEGGEIVDAPRNDEERATMDKAVSILADKLKMEPSEVQAVLWYYEQQLWKAHGSKVESGSYSKAAEKVANGDSYDLGRAQFEAERKQIEKGRKATDTGGLYGGDVPGRSGSGPSKPDFLPGGKFVEDDVKPLVAGASDGVKKAWEGVKSLVAPFTRSRAARVTSNILRERGGELSQRFGRLDEAFHKARDVFDKLSVSDSRQFIDDVENGRKTTNPALQPIADAVRAILDDRLKQVQALGTGKLTDFIKDYFPHIWENPTKAAKVWQEAVAKAPIEGGKKFLKARTLPTLAEGLARGLKPVTENPIEAMMLRVREMDKYITAHQAFQEMESLGLLKKVKAREVGNMPGYAKINDNIATTYAKPSRRGAIQIQSYRMAPEAVANVINNYLSPGLRSNKYFGAAFRGYLTLGNTMNQAQLGLSAFHAAFVSYDAAVSSFAIGLKNLAKGRVLTGSRQVGEAMTLVGPAIRSWRNGTQIMKEWNSPGSTTPQIAALVDAMKAGGGRITMDEFHRTGWRDSLKKAVKAGNGIGAALRLPLATLEAVSAPILEKMVPRMKAGVFFEMAQHELDNLKGNTDRNAMREAMGKAWDSVDNRMGELVYDNLFWNKTVKDLAMASTRSVGWNLGTLREVGGGLLDLAKNAGSATLGRGRNVEFTHRAAYAVALPVMTGILGAILHRLMTGENPKELKDYYFPKTGRKDKDGHDVRLTLPSYIKDVFAYQANPGTTISHKLHPMANTIMEMLSNSDYYGTKIVNEDDNPLKQAADYAKHFGKAFIPFGAREAVKLQSEGQGARSILPLLGITEARRDITNSPAELLASKLAVAGMPKGTRTQEEADKSQLTRDLADKVKSHEPGAIGEIQEALKTGKLTPSSIANIKERQQYSAFERTIRHLSVEEAMKVWDVASPDERRVMAKFVIPRAIREENLPKERKDAILKRLAQDWKSLSATAEKK